jgi:NO-binding membrane sensor protein with MHYT domain
MLLFTTVLLSLSLGVFASYVALHVILHAFGSRRREPRPALLARAQAAGD